MRINDNLAKVGRRKRAASPAAADRLSDLAFSPNPGRLLARSYVPEGLADGAPLVVVLHGCTQDAATYDYGSGWSRLADRHGFALLFPEQQRANNPGLCFNWFAANHSQRGMGEPASIKAMVDAMAKAHGIDRSRVFVTGLSAGGAMSAVMLATYPELFAAGAIIAGLPYGCASGVTEAFDCMGGRAGADTADLAASVRRASPHKGAWPRVSIWQGGADRTVVPSNADALARQWAELHGLSEAPSRTETADGFPRRVWTGPEGEELIEHYAIPGMAHGIPLMPGTGEGESGVAGAHMLDVGLSSTDRIAAFFGIAPPVKPGVGRTAGTKPATAKVPARQPRRPASRRPVPQQPEAGPEIGGVQKVIEDALRAAGLMR